MASDFFKYVGDIQIVTPPFTRRAETPKKVEKTKSIVNTWLSAFSQHIWINLRQPLIWQKLFDLRNRKQINHWLGSIMAFNIKPYSIKNRWAIYFQFLHAENSGAKNYCPK